MEYLTSCFKTSNEVVRTTIDSTHFLKLINYNIQLFRQPLFYKVQSFSNIKMFLDRSSSLVESPKLMSNMLRQLADNFFRTTLLSSGQRIAREFLFWKCL